MQIGPFKSEVIESFAAEPAQREMKEALAKVRGHASQVYPLVIGGKKVHTKDSIVSTNPSNPSEVVGATAQANNEHADQALAAAWKAFDSWKRWPQEERSLVLLKTAEVIRKRRREFEACLVLEIGKNLVDASAEVAETIEFLEYYARQAMKHSGSIEGLTPYPGEHNSSFYVPLGAGVAIAPWNFPMALMTTMVAGAIVVGNTMVCKPAEDTVVSCAKLVEAFEEAGLPAGVLNFLPGIGRDVGEYLVAHPQTRFISFTGSLAVGARINEIASRLSPGQKWFKRVFLELGGKNAVLVDESADLDVAATGIIEGAYGYQGQKCSACSRLVVVDSVYDALIDRVVAHAEKINVGAAENNPRNGPIINAAQEKKILQYLDIAKGEGKLVTGGRRLDGAGYFFAPTIYGDVDQNARIAQEEVFGPFVAAIRVKNFEEGMQVVANTNYGLTGSVYSRTRERLEYARREFHVGNLYFNRKNTGALVGIQPFGGFNLSGTDTKVGGPDYLLQFLQMKAVAERF
ncbi:L-glutamate gamma-semialdehyde dehydrogenase [Herbaspirillum sp. GCM10030257]|uniref:L-glutamate gamma-semialdehyde dehydrogenase n=1 Tax=Herbaspirillum sp. GCM10030257 TaxID=3273393 RepID=UPI0036209492